MNIRICFINIEKIAEIQSQSEIRARAYTLSGEFDKWNAGKLLNLKKSPPNFVTRQESLNYPSGRNLPKTTFSVPRPYSALDTLWNYERRNSDDLDLENRDFSNNLDIGTQDDCYFCHSDENLSPTEKYFIPIEGSNERNAYDRLEKRLSTFIGEVLENENNAPKGPTDKRTAAPRKSSSPCLRIHQIVTSNGESISFKPGKYSALSQPKISYV